MKRLNYIFILILLNGCVIQKNERIVIYGKIWQTSGKHASIVFTPEKYQIGNSWKKVDNWQDSLEYQYVKVTGLLELNKYKLDTTRTDIQTNYIKYLVKNAKVEVIQNDSIICSIDSALGRCIEMRRFINRLQVDKVLDSLVLSNILYFNWDDEMGIKITANRFINNGSKPVYLSYDLSSNIKISEYFVLSKFPCAKDSEYNVLLTLIRKEGDKTHKNEYLLTGDHNKIFIMKK